MQSEIGVGLALIGMIPWSAFGGRLIAAEDVGHQVPLVVGWIDRILQGSLP